MSFIVPKKPQILYAPMLASFGGGSARGFNPGGGGLLPGEAIFYQTSAGSQSIYTWTVPDGVTSISLVLVGPGGSGVGFTGRGSGGGGGLCYLNNLSVTEGSTFSVRPGGWQSDSSDSEFTYFNTSGYLYAGPGTSGGQGTGGVSGGTASGRVVNSGGDGGQGGSDSSGGDGGGGGGAAGYSGSGGRGGDYNSGNATDGSGGGGGGGEGRLQPGGGFGTGGDGGGVGLFGQGTSGAKGGSGTSANQGKAGSGGGSTDPTTTPTTTLYGGGGGGSYSGSMSENQKGAVRIIWPGDSRTFPTSSVGRADSEIVYINNVQQ
jgi:hypothetical protein